MQNAYNKSSIFQDKFTFIRKKIEQMNCWIKQKYYPVLKVMHIYEYKVKNLRIVIYNTGNWSIPITYTQTYINFNNTSPKIWLNVSDVGRVHSPHVEELSIIDLKEKDWIIFNL